MTAPDQGRDPFATPQGTPGSQSGYPVPPPPPGYAAPPPPPGYAVPPPPPPAYAAPPPSPYVTPGQGPQGYAYAPPPSSYPGAVSPTKNNWQGVTAMWCGIGGLVVNLCLPFVWLAAIVFGIIGLVSVKNGTATNKGQNIAGIVLGGLWVLAGIVFVVIGIVTDSSSPTY